MRSRTLNEEVRDAMAVLEKSLRLAAPMYEAVGAAAGRWELVPGVEAPLMAAATVVLANGWARVGP